MSDDIMMGCPCCNKPLHCGSTIKTDEYLIDLYQCANPECKSTEFLVGCKEFWDILGQLERTRKALGIAVDALKRIKYGKVPVSLGISMDINDALDEITALEQKDAK